MNRYLFILTIVTSTFLNAQSNILNTTKLEDIGKYYKQKLEDDNDRPIPYGYVDDRDIMWSKVVWEYIDLNQKINLPYYYPIKPIQSSIRKSLFSTLINAINEGAIKNFYYDSEFKDKYTLEELKKTKLEYEIIDETDFKDKKIILPEDIEGFMLKGIWYFDKRHGELKYRILAIAPMSKDISIMYSSDLKNVKIDEISPQPLFWVFYPEVREVLHKSKVFNPKNALHPISYDHLLNARRFNSIIVQEENIYGNRAIADYVRGNSLFQLLEADKIKEDIRNREMDMWNY